MPNIFNISQNNTYRITGAFRDEAGAPILLTALNTVNLTLYYYNPDLTTADKYHYDIINNRNNTNIRNANNSVIDPDGNWTWTILPADTAKLNSQSNEEVHVALVKWYWSPGKKNSQEIIFNVRRVQYI